MRWAQRLKRVFNIDIETCNSCGGNVKIIACIEDPQVIAKILSYFERKDTQLLPRVCHRLDDRRRSVCSNETAHNYAERLTAATLTKRHGYCRLDGGNCR